MEHAIIVAAKKGDVDAVRAELDSGVSPEITGKYGCTALHWAAEMGRIEVISLLLDRGADVNVREGGGKHTAEDSIEEEASVIGATPLHHAAMEGSAASAALLIARGADVNALERDGWTPLHRAARSRHMSGSPSEFVEVLVAAGADVNALDTKGRTPLHVAADWNCPRVAQALVAAGADKCAVDGEGKTPYDLACKPRNETELITGGQDLAALQRLLRPASCGSSILVAMAVLATIVAVCLSR